MLPSLGSMLLIFHNFSWITFPFVPLCLTGKKLIIDYGTNEGIINFPLDPLIPSLQHGSRYALHDRYLSTTAGPTRLRQPLGLCSFCILEEASAWDVIHVDSP